MSYLNNNATYGSSSVNGLSNSFSNLGFQPAGGYSQPLASSYSSIPIPPPLPQQSLYQSNNNSFLNGRNLYTREWSQSSQYSSLPATTSYTTSSVLPATSSFVSAPVVSAPIVAAPIAGNMLPAPINDGRRYARLTGQKAGSRRSRRHLVQPLNGTGLQTLPAGVPVEGLAAASAAGLGGRRSRGRNSRGLNNNLNSSAGFPGTSNYVSLGAAPNASGLPLATSPLASASALPIQQQQFASAPISSSFISAPATSSIVSAPIVSAPLVSAAPIAAAPIAGNMLPAPINDGRRYARLTGQKAGSRRSRRHLVQPLNGTGLQTLPAGVPVEGLAAASVLANNNGRRSRRMASRGLNNGSFLSAAPLATTGLATTGLATSGIAAAAPLASSVIAPVGTSVLPQPHLAQIPLGAPRAGRGSRRNRRNNAGLTSAVPLTAAPLMPVTTAPLMSSGSLLSQPMIKQEVYAPIAQPSYVGGAAF